eukprot:3736319-Alexandrium_andersonii.AAC.1
MVMRLMTHPTMHLGCSKLVRSEGRGSASSSWPSSWRTTSSRARPQTGSRSCSPSRQCQPHAM